MDAYGTIVSRSGTNLLKLELYREKALIAKPSIAVMDVLFPPLGGLFGELYSY